MYMILNAIDTVQLAISIFYNTRNILIQFFTICFWNSRFPLLCSKNDLVKDLTVAHNSYLNGKKLRKCKDILVIFPIIESHSTPAGLMSCNFRLSPDGIRGYSY